MSDHVSEDDIRTKVVTAWLYGHGISPADIKLEFTFAVRLGRSTFHAGARDIFHPRADVLVSDSHGRNLLIVEVKAPHERLDDDSRDQGISYARGLAVGNMPPFVVVTNGHDTTIFDTLTKSELNGTTIPLDHPHVRAGYCISADDLALRAEALEMLISLSPTNLLQFCRDQTAYHMARLRSEDLQSGKKYIPSLFVERSESADRLRELIDEKGRSVALVIGRPQIGKTSFICHQVEQRLEDSTPCLFLPAIGMRGSILTELASDFGHLLGDHCATHLDILSRLRRVAARSNARIILFVDGWNEATAEVARSIDQDSDRVTGNNLQLVVSLTNTAATRLLRDAAGNPSRLAEAAQLSAGAPALIEADRVTNSQKRPWSVVDIPAFTDSERARAYDLYCQAYRVFCPETHQRTSEPYLLAIAMEQYANSSLPSILDEPALLGGTLQRKASRVVGMEQKAVPGMLEQLAHAMHEHGAPLPVTLALRAWNSPSTSYPPHGLYDAALLAECSDQYCTQSIDFYYGRERDYAIAYLACQWHRQLTGPQEIAAWAELATKQQAGVDALRWFFRQRQIVFDLRQSCGGYPRFENPLVQNLFLSGLCDLVTFGESIDDSLLEYAASFIHQTQPPSLMLEAIRLTSLATEDAESLADGLAKAGSLSDAVRAILTIGDEYPLAPDSPGEVVLDALKSLHWGDLSREVGVDDLEHSEVSAVLAECLRNATCKTSHYAAECLGHVAPLLFFQELLSLWYSRPSVDVHCRLEAVDGGIQNATSELQELYYGSMYCSGSGYIDYLVGSENPSALLEEYSRVSRVIAPIIEICPGSLTEGLSDLLKALRPCGEVDHDFNDTSFTPSPLNRLLPFMDQAYDATDE
jgi:hypothetical protein